MNGVSIIICCFNSSSRIINTLQHLQRQKVNNLINWEVIVVDNASTDNTAEKAKEIWQQNPLTNFFVLLEPIPGVINARRCGLNAASYDIISFIDDDNWVEELWVQKVYDLFTENSAIGACWGRNDAVFEKEPPYWFSQFATSFAVGRQADDSGFVDIAKGVLWTAGLSFRKSIWGELQSRGFKNITIGREGKNLAAGEDSELCYAISLLGYRFYFSDDLTLKHFMPAVRMNFSYLEKMNTGFGKAYARLNCYRVLLYRGSFKFHAWWYEWAASVKRIIRLTAEIIFISDQQKKQKAKVNRAYWKGYASQLLQDRNRLKLIIEEIRKVFKPL